MRKRAVALVLVVLLVLAVPVQAMSRAISFAPTLSFSGVDAVCVLNVQGESGDEIEATMTLWRGSTRVATWYDEGTTYLRMREIESVPNGYTYTLKVDVTINGVRYDQESVSKYFS